MSLRSDLVRDALIRHGVQPGDRVGIAAPKSIPVVAVIFGILEARAAYVPMDTTAPPTRNATIIEDCSIKAAVVSKSVLDGLRSAVQGGARELADLGDELLLVAFGPSSMTVGEIGSTPKENPVDVPAAESADDLSYILYTSGSTGQPKGIVHTHRSALSFINWCTDAFVPTVEDRFSSHAPFHFDLSILDLFLPIKHGATLVLISDEVAKQPLRLGPLISEQRITVWYSTPSILRLLTEFGKLNQLEFPALRLVLFAGEVFPVKHLRALKRIWRRPVYYNLYGPTETNVCTAYEIPADIPDDRMDPFPIGFACSGDRTAVVNDQGRTVEAGNEGELIVSGGSVMREYWNAPAKTQKAFVTDEVGTRWYRTGDIVSESPSDGYVFRGRRDRMVKRRGYRVELGEIEIALTRHPAVAECAVISLTDPDSGVLISAFVVVPEGSHPSLVEMKRFCAEHLPLYMIPDRFSFAQSLPRTATDKVDYQRLGVSSDDIRATSKSE